MPPEAMSTKSVMKGFITVGTTINRGEDLAAKGRGEPTSPSVERATGLTVLCSGRVIWVVPGVDTNVDCC